MRFDLQDSSDLKTSKFFFLDEVISKLGRTLYSRLMHGTQYLKLIRYGSDYIAKC